MERGGTKEMRREDMSEQKTESAAEKEGKEGGLPQEPSSAPEGKRYAYFSHRDCEYFPCHPGANPENFNCLFCYCPLYALGPNCGGAFQYRDGGVKDCSACLFPHRRENYPEVLRRYPELLALMSDSAKDSRKNKCQDTKQQCGSAC